MSFMPNLGTIVRMKDGRIAIVAEVSPEGGQDSVMFDNGHVEKTDAWQVAEALTDPCTGDFLLESLLSRLNGHLGMCCIACGRADTPLYPYGHTTGEGPTFQCCETCGERSGFIREVSPRRTPPGTESTLKRWLRRVRRRRE